MRCKAVFWTRSRSPAAAIPAIPEPEPSPSSCEEVLSATVGETVCIVPVLFILFGLTTVEAFYENIHRATWESEKKISRATAGLVLVLLCRPEKSKLWRKLRGFVRCNVFCINLTRFTLDANPGNQTIWKLTRCVDLSSRKAHKTASQRDQSCVEADLARLLMQSCVIAWSKFCLWFVSQFWLMQIESWFVLFQTNLLGRTPWNTKFSNDKPAIPAPNLPQRHLPPTQEMERTHFRGPFWIFPR